MLSRTRQTLFLGSESQRPILSTTRTTLFKQYVKKYNVLLDSWVRVCRKSSGSFEIVAVRELPLSRLSQSVKTLAKLESPCLLNIYEIFQDTHSFYFISENMQVTLTDVIMVSDLAAEYNATTTIIYQVRDLRLIGFYLYSIGSSRYLIYT